MGFINSPKIEISFEDVLNDFETVFSKTNLNKIDIVNVINKYVPDFKHNETGRNLDQKM